MGGSAPSPDPNIGIAALKSAKVGEQMMSWMQDQAQITNRWAAEDRTRWENTFRPLQDQYVREARDWANPERKEARASEAIADTRLQARIADGTRVRQAMAMGVNPDSGRFASASAKAGVDAALGAVGAGNLARRAVEAEGDARFANAINMGSGMAVNPATSMGLSNQAITTGGNAAMSGYGQQGDLLNTDYQNRMQAWQANQSGLNGFFGALGSVAGMMGGFPSSKKLKTDKKPLKEGAALGAVRDMPVEEWRYKPGVADGGQHVGPYAEDFKAATGKGDGKSIPAQDAIGLALGAVRDLDKKIDKLAAVAGAKTERRAA